MRMLAPALLATLFLATPAQADPIAWPFGVSPIVPQLLRHKPRATRAARARFQSPAGSSRQLFDLVSAAARRHGVPVRLAHAIVRVESGYRCDARSRSGALGIMQVLPRTAAGVGVGGNLLECATGLEAGMRYLGRAVRAGGAGCAGASFYNTGVAAKPRCTGYGRRVMALVGAPS